MSTEAPHNVAIAVLFLLLGGVLLLTVAPFEIGTIRLAGVSLLWWYAVVAVPIAGGIVTVAALARREVPPRAADPAVDAAAPAAE
ncbi:MAG TPA: hypothetical protein VGQ77_01150 [Methylomirabilota bacterium]|nr:hypothetical protein [Methylomirabilota bacterium]